MAQQVCVVLSTAEREQLLAIAADRNRPRKHIERARIVLASADRHSPQRIAQGIGVSRPTVWRWQQRFAESGAEGRLRDDPQGRQASGRGGSHGAGGGADPRLRRDRTKKKCRECEPPHTSSQLGLVCLLARL